MKACTGCGSTESIEEIRTRNPRALSCCPDRRMVERNEIAYCVFCKKEHVGGATCMGHHP